MTKQVNRSRHWALLAAMTPMVLLGGFKGVPLHCNAVLADDDDESENAKYPKPDFSAMEKWYIIVRYEYSVLTDQQLSIWYKPKTDKIPPSEFTMKFFDKDGVLVDPFDTDFGTGINFHFGVPKEQTGKADVYTPSEKTMERVVKAEVYRIVR